MLNVNVAQTWESWLRDHFGVRVLTELWPYRSTMLRDQTVGVGKAQNLPIWNIVWLLLRNTPHMWCEWFWTNYYSKMRLKKCLTFNTELINAVNERTHLSDLKLIAALVGSVQSLPVGSFWILYQRSEQGPNETKILTWNYITIVLCKIACLGEGLKGPKNP